MKRILVTLASIAALTASPAMAQILAPEDVPDAGAAVGAAIVGGILGGVLGAAVGGHHIDRAGLIGHLGGGGGKKGALVAPVHGHKAGGGVVHRRKIGG